MAAIEMSYDRDWLRPRFALFYATGDDKPRDREGTGFDSIFDGPRLRRRRFSFFNRLGIRLSQTGVALVDRGSLLTSLRSSKDEGQSNYVNPGVQLASIGLDIEVAAPQGHPDRQLHPDGHDRVGSRGAAVPGRHRRGARHRPEGSVCDTALQHCQQWIVVGGVADSSRTWIQRHLRGDDPLYHVFSNIILQF